MKQTLEKIPFQLLPQSLKTKITLPNLREIEIRHKNQSQMYLSTMNFLKQYGPSIQYYNENLLIKHITDSKVQIPQYKIFNSESKQVEQFDVANLKVGEDILTKIIEINDQINSQNKGSISEVKFSDFQEEGEEGELQEQQQ